MGEVKRLENHKYSTQIKWALENRLRLAYPALTDLATFVIVLALGVPSVYIFSKVLKLRPQTTMLSEKKKEGVLSLLVFAAVLGATFGIYGFYDKVWVRATLTADPLYVLRDTIWIALILLPVIAALRWSKQTFESIGAKRKDLKKNLALGLLPSSIFLLFVGILSSFFGSG